MYVVLLPYVHVGRRRMKMMLAEVVMDEGEVEWNDCRPGSMYVWIDR